MQVSEADKRLIELRKHLVKAAREIEDDLIKRRVIKRRLVVSHECVKRR